MVENTATNTATNAKVQATRAVVGHEPRLDSELEKGRVERYRFQ